MDDTPIGRWDPVASSGGDCVPDDIAVVLDQAVRPLSYDGMTSYTGCPRKHIRKRKSVSRLATSTT